MHSPNAALLARARNEYLDTGAVSTETRADLAMVGVSSAELEIFLSLATGA